MKKIILLAFLLFVSGLINCVDWTEADRKLNDSGERCENFIQEVESNVVNGTVTYQEDEDWNAIGRSTTQVCGTWESTGIFGCGTGILVAPRVILTVAHLFGNENTRVEEPIDNTARFKSADGLLQKIPLDMSKEEDLENGQDLGILILEFPPSVSIPYWRPSSELTNDMWLIGYGNGDDGDDTLEKATGCSMSGPLYNSYDNSRMGSMDCECGMGEGGDSGAPVFNNKNEIVGLHKSSVGHSSDFIYLGTSRSDYRKFIEDKIAQYKTKLIIANFDGRCGVDFLFWNDQGNGSWIDLSGTSGLDYKADDTLGSWCKSSLYTGDFNGDGNVDLLCYNNRSKIIMIDYSDNGQFNGTNLTAIYDWCDDEIFVGDFNGDGYDDLYCRDATNLRYVDFNSQNFDRPFIGPSWQTQNGWCGLGEQLVGDFNGDDRDDLLCFISGKGMYIKYASINGTFDESHISRATDWCGDGKLYIGNFDGDNIDDLFCWGTNSMYIDYGNNVVFPFEGTNWQNINTKWCREKTTELTIGDVNGDGKDDLVCYNTSTGQIYIDSAREKYNTFDSINENIFPPIQ